MTHEQVQEKLEQMGIEYDEDTGYPKNSEILKIVALYELVGGYLKHEFTLGILKMEAPAGLLDEHFDDWLREGMEEFLFG